MTAPKRLVYFSLNREKVSNRNSVAAGAGPLMVRCPIWWNRSNRLKVYPSARHTFTTKPTLLCNTRYTEERKSATLTVKKSAIQSWEIFRHKVDSNYWQAINVFWQTIRRLRGERSHTSTGFRWWGLGAQAWWEGPCADTKSLGRGRDGRWSHQYFHGWLIFNVILLCHIC